MEGLELVMDIDTLEIYEVIDHDAEEEMIDEDGLPSYKGKISLPPCQCIQQTLFDFLDNDNTS